MKKTKKILSLLISACILTFLLVKNYYPELFAEVIPETRNDMSKSNTDTTLKDSSDTKISLQVHFIDVGQGDSILIESENHYMLIDAGENEKGDMVVDYLKNQNVTKLDYVIGTHPHSDHIGGLDNVINSFVVDKVILPDVIHNTKTFEDMLDAIADNNLKITNAAVGNTYTLGLASFTIISPNGIEYNDLNNYSVGIKLTNGNNSFIFTGDAEELSEKEMLDNGINLSADVLKLGHHGSAYSSSDEFLSAVNPSIAIISAGIGNSYGHPHVEVLKKMLDLHITVYRTDKQGSIVVTSDGNNLTIDKEPYTITSKDLEE